MPRQLDARGPTVTVSGEAVPRSLIVAGVTVILLGLAGLGILTVNPGTGEAEVDDVRAQFRHVVEALADGDGDIACAAMAPEVVAAFTEGVADGVVTGRTCEELVGRLAVARTPEASTALRGVEIVDIRIVMVGDEALELPDRAEVDLDEGMVVFGRRSGCAGSMDCWELVDADALLVLAAPDQGGRP